MVLYSIVPWIGVMAAGYAFGSIVTEPAGQRRRRCLLIGGAAVSLFLVLRTFNLYGDPNHWSPSGRLPAPLSFLSHHEVSGVARLPAHDARADDSPDTASGRGARVAGAAR